MGFHIVVRRPAGSVEKHYVDSLEQLYVIDGVSDDTIIYQAEEQWVPFLIGEREEYRQYLDRRRRIGHLAQLLFEKQAEEEHLHFQKIDQSQSDFGRTTGLSGGRYVKRPDYNIENLERKLAVEVKARSLKVDGNCAAFTIDYSEVKALATYQEAFRTTVAFCVYRIIEENLDPGQCYVVSVDEILELNRVGKLSYDPRNKYLSVSCSSCRQGLGKVAEIGK